jgi:hypothetical protein
VWEGISLFSRRINKLLLALGFALAATAAYGGNEIFPVVSNQPITIRILSGHDGQPLTHLHLVLIGGYDQRDLRVQQFREEVLTDAHGRVQLSNQLANLPWLQVWVSKKPLCQAHPRTASFSVELIRRDGLSAPNRCGTATVENAPGVFTVFVKGKGEPPAPLPVAILPAPSAKPALSAIAAPVQAPAPVASCACPKKTNRGTSVCDRLGNAFDGLARSFRY